jgi:hypothetical protein
MLAIPGAQIPQAREKHSRKTKFFNINIPG